MVFSALFLILFVLGLSIEGPLTLNPENAAVKILELDPWLRFTVYESEPGPIFFIEYALILVGILYVMIMTIFKSTNHHNHSYRKVFLITFSIVTLIALNDILLGANLYRFIYLFEFAHLVIIFL